MHKLMKMLLHGCEMHVASLMGDKIVRLTGEVHMVH